MLYVISASVVPGSVANVDIVLVLSDSLPVWHALFERRLR